jgi:hypothetical protein
LGLRGGCHLCALFTVLLVCSDADLDNVAIKLAGAYEWS